MMWTSPTFIDTPKSLTKYQTWRFAMEEPKGRRRYDREFKEGAVRLILDGDRTVRSVARDLGIHENMLHRWKQEYLLDKEPSFPGKGQARRAIFEYIEIFYNRQRRHSALNQNSPLEYYQDAAQTL